MIMNIETSLYWVQKCCSCSNIDISCNASSTNIRLNGSSISSSYLDTKMTLSYIPKMAAVVVVLFSVFHLCFLN